VVVQVACHLQGKVDTSSSCGLQLVNTRTVS
jgi:hypothetical protein